MIIKQVTFICTYKGFSIKRDATLLYYIELNPMRFSTLELAKQHIDQITKNKGYNIIHK